MSRAIFYLIKEDADGNIQLDRDIGVGNLSATKDGAAFGASFINNGDGTYYFAPSGSGIYSVFLNGLVQDEFRDIYVGTDDLLKTSQIDDTTIVLDGQGRLSVVNGDTLLRQGDVVDNLQSTSSVYPLSANQGLQLSASISTKLGSSATLLFEEDVLSDFTTGGTDKVQSASSLLLDLAGTNFLSDQTSYNAAIRELDRRIGLFQYGGAYRSYLLYGYASNLDEGDTGIEMKTVDGVTNGRGYRMMRAGTVTSMAVVFEVTNYTRGGSGDFYTVLFDIYKNGSLYSVVQVEQVINTNQVYGATSNAPQGSFSAGDTFMVKFRSQAGIGDNFDLSQISIAIEITT